MAVSETLACILGKTQTGQLTRKQAEKLEAAHRAQLDYLSRSMSPEAAEAAAARRVSQLFEKNAHKARYDLAQQIRVESARMTELERHPRGQGAGAMSLLVADRAGGQSARTLEGRQYTATQLLFSRLPQLIGLTRPRGLGPGGNQREAAKIIDGLHGSKVDSPTAAAVREFEEMRAEAHERLRAAGVEVAELDNRGVAHNWSPERFDKAIRRAMKTKGTDGKRLTRAEAREAVKNEFVADVMAEIDRGAMLDRRTGAPLSEPDLEALVREAFETIRSGGLNKLEPGAGASAVSPVSERHSRQRVLHFKSGAAWRRIDDKWGSGGDYYGALTHEVHGLGRDIGLFEHFGPEPTAFARRVEDIMRKDAAVGGEASLNTGVLGGFRNTRAALRPGWFHAQYDLLAGLVHPEATGFARGMQAYRNIRAATDLGGAAITAGFGDRALQSMARSFYGLSQAPSLKQFFQGMTSKDTDLALRTALGGEIWTNAGFAAVRHTGEAFGSGASRWTLDAVMRVSGLSFVTQASRASFGRNFLHDISDLRAKGFDELPDQMRRNLAAVDIGPDDWNAIRRAPTIEWRGVEMIDPPSLARAGHLEPAEKLLEIISRGQEVASPIGDARLRTIMRGGRKPGTITGEIAQTAGMYKSFPVQMTLTHLPMLWNHPSGRIAGLAAFSKFAVHATLMGAAIVQAKEVLYGRDPLPMDNWQFWLRAMAVGGFLGVWGDIILFDAPTAAHKLQRILGPGAEDAAGLADLAFVGGLESKPGKVKDLAEGFLPGTRIWYLNVLVFQRIGDEIEALLDPDAPDKWQQAETRREKQGQGTWWGRGEMTPRRGPSMEGVLPE